MQHIANAGARRQWREEGLDLVLGGENGLAKIERDEGGERGGLAGVGAGLDLLGKARCDGLPDRRLVAGLRDGNYAELLPELGEGAKNGGLGDLLAQIRGERICTLRAVLDEEGVGVGG